MRDAILPPLTHNGLPAIDSADDLPDGLAKMHYFKCDIDALWNVLVELPFDVGGFYMRALLAMYKHMESLPADDNVARMRLGGIDIRTYRRMKAALLAQPKCFYEKPSGRVSNARFEDEITAYVTEFKNRQIAAKDREAKKRGRADFQETSGKSRLEVREKSAGSPVEVGHKLPLTNTNQTPDLSKKSNKINGDDTTTLAEQRAQDDHEAVLRARVTRTRTIDRSREEKEIGGGSAPAREADANAVLPWRFNADGSFSGTAFENFTFNEISGMAATYPHVEWPRILAEADVFLAKVFEQDGTPFDHPSRMTRLHGFLSKKNAAMRILIEEQKKSVRTKSEVAPDDSCWFADDRLMVANGFKSELLDLVGGDERRLRLTLDKAAISVPIDLKGAALRKVVRGQFTRNADWQAQDERKTTAYEKKIGPADAPGTPSKFDKMRAAAEKAQAAIDGKTR